MEFKANSFIKFGFVEFILEVFDTVLRFSENFDPLIGQKDDLLKLDGIVHLIGLANDPRDRSLDV